VSHTKKYAMVPYFMPFYVFAADRWGRH